ncbi:ninein-like protein isoform X2 [Sander lucioperca]|uniref:ninein-like protein isoform X2 n=1 Tax=Sander lucioperca TaxID=283035 RepID=UPI0016538147|nr:ninein-like protein isoform X2 [Sander lucioperca]
MYCTSGLISGCGLLTWVSTDRKTAYTRTSCYTQCHAVLEERSARSTSPSLLTAAAGQRVLSRLDDGSGCTSPERVISLWTEEGIRNSREILQTLDFPLEERVSLADLTLALDNEMLVSGNGIHQAALLSYKNEIQHLQVVAEQACRERDKVKSDLDQADQRNLQLVREVDDRHASMETLNQTMIRDLEQDFRDRLAALRSQSEQESEALLVQAERERRTLQDELQLLRASEAELQEELRSATQENGRLEEEGRVVKLKLTEAESSVSRLQRDLDALLHHKFGGLDPTAAGLSHEERFSEIVKDYELQCRELRDRNDELSSELELLTNQRSDRKSRRSKGDADATLSWSEQRPASTESDSDESEMKRISSPLVRKKLQPADKAALCSLDGVSGPAVSIQTELALETLKQKHNQELQQLHIKLETQVNYYERSLEVMRQSMEVERKDISQAFKMEISELEDQKAQAEQQVKQLKEKLQTQIQHGGGGGGGGGGWSNEQERRMQRERAELEQNFAREISNLVQRLSAEKEQLEAELKLKMDQDLMLVRKDAEQQLSHVTLQHAESLRQLEKNAHLHISQSEAALQELRGRCGHLEDDLEASRGRCSELEARLEEACAQLAVLESHKLSNERMASEKDELLLEVSRLKEELGNMRAASDSILQGREAAKDNYSRLSDAFVQQQAQLGAREQTLNALRAELQTLQECLAKRAAELDSLKTDRARLIQDLKEQAMAVDTLRLQLDGVSEESDRCRSGERRLQEALTRVQCSLRDEKEQVCRLSQENASYARLADQLAGQIVEMEAEISTLREHLGELSAQLNDTADLVLELRTQLNSKTGQVDRLRAEVADADNLLRQVSSLEAKRDFEEEKQKMTQQLMELERLVLALEDGMDPASLHRTQLEEVRLENGALQERLTVLQQEVHNLEDEVANKRRKLEEMEQEHERSREDEERLHKENSRYREEVLDLSGRNLQLSNDNAELSARLRGDQESLRMLRERLATVSKEREEKGTTVRQLQDAALQQEREKLQLQAVWTQERQLLERELSTFKEKLGRLSALEAELSGATLKLQRLEEDKSKLLREADDRNNKVEKLQQSLLAVESEAELLRSQLHAVGQEKLGHVQEVTSLHRKLQDAQSKVEELESSVRTLLTENEELRHALEEQEEQEETHKLRVQNQELQHQLSEQQNLKTKLTQLETERTQAQDQVVRADTALGLVQAQHARRLQELQRCAADGYREQTEQLHARLLEEQRKSQQLEEQLRLQNQQSSAHVGRKQDQYEKALSALQQRMEELETKLKGVRMVLQEKVQELKEQLARNRKSSALLKDLYVENSQLMKALQVTEQRQKHAEKKNFQLEDKVSALNKLLQEIVPASLIT